MVSGLYCSLRKVLSFYAFLLLFVCPGNSSINPVVIPSQFFIKIHTLINCENVKTILEKCSNALLFNPEGDNPEGEVLCLSGVRPIMNSFSQKTLSKECSVRILDIFDVIIANPLTADHVRDAMYNYLIVYGIKTLINVISKSPVKAVCSQLMVPNLRDRLLQMASMQKDSLEIIGFVDKLLSNNRVNSTQKKEIVDTIKPYIDTQFKDVERNAVSMLEIYLTGLEEYYRFSQEIHEEKGMKALFGCTVLRQMQQDQVGDCIAYLNDPRSIKAKDLHDFAVKVDARVPDEDHMDGIVQLSHTEPMIVFFLQKLNKGIQYFFSYRDMCQNCRPIIASAIQQRKMLIPLVVLSQQSCSGQTGIPSTVDFEWKEAQLTPQENEKIEGICQIRSSEWFSISNNIKVKFEDLSQYQVEIK